MNKERLTEVALWLEAGAPERKFNMNRFLNTDETTPLSNWCGTECCIAGYAVTKYAPEQVISAEMYGNVDDIARDLLGLSNEDARQLFYAKSPLGYSYTGQWEDISPYDAAIVVRNLIKTGEVNWSLALEFDE